MPELPEVETVARELREGGGARGPSVLGRLLVDHRDIQRPKIFPTPDGGVQAEWVIGSWAAEARFLPDDEVLLLEATNGETNEERSTSMPAGAVSADNAAGLASWLADLMSAESNGVQ